MKVLIEGWTDIPHSYTIVNVLQMYYMSKYHPDVQIFIKSKRYPTSRWNSLSGAWFFSSEIQEFLKTLRNWTPGVDIDIVYRISYPFDVSRHNTAPVVVFLPMEFARLNPHTIVPRITDGDIRSALSDTLYFVTPSNWSAKGLEPYFSQTDEHARVIPHGVDLDMFRRLADRRVFRKSFGIPEDVVVFLHAGAMTRNKGTYETLYLLFRLVVQHKCTWIHLVLKCSEDLYQSSRFIEDYIHDIAIQENSNIHTVRKFIDTHTTILTETLSFDGLNQLYNASDIYMAPYSGEGFNLIPLEAVCSGCKLVITSGGASDDYLVDIVKECPEAVILLPGKNVMYNGEMRLCQVNLPESLELLQNSYTSLMSSLTDEQVDRCRRAISERFSWKAVVDTYVNHFRNILRN